MSGSFWQRGLGTTARPSFFPPFLSFHNVFEDMGLRMGDTEVAVLTHS